MADLLPKRGRPGLTLLMTVRRDLTSHDLLRLTTEPQRKIAPPMLQKLKASHHTAARLVAAGRSHEEVALITGYTKQRISDMQSTDPAFQELVSYYQSQITEIEVDDAKIVHKQLVEVGQIALTEIQTRLADDNLRSEIPFSELRQVAAFGFDRTVAPPKTSQPIMTIPPRITIKIGERDLKPREPLDVTPAKEIEHEG